MTQNDTTLHRHSSMTTTNSRKASKATKRSNDQAAMGEETQRAGRRFRRGLGFIAL
jgi:hypothetical protein